jgi:2-polyprenyl-6-methoxyphenol hydroxylase-like FAD-dependent oxidoreductase
MKSKSVLISGASIAGPALGYWLNRYGYDVSIVEKAAQLREGGYKIDIRGVAVEVVKRTGIYMDVKELSCDMLGASFVDDDGKKIVDFPAELIGMREEDDVELMRGDLSKLLYIMTYKNCKYIFNDSITELIETQDGIYAKFEKGDDRTYDLVIGADGIHSNVRKLIFGKEEQFTHSFGDYYFAICSTTNHLKLDRQELFYGAANKVVNVYSTKDSTEAKALFAFRSADFKYDRKDTGQNIEQIRKMFSDMKWQVPALLKSIDNSPHFYFDTVNQIRMTSWSSGRVALIGDAAYGPSWASGQGTSMALVGAYLLAGELLRAEDNYQEAFKSFQDLMQDFVEKNQKLGESVHEIVPKSKFGLWMQIKLLRFMPYLPGTGIIIKKMKAKVKIAANAVELPQYESKLQIV